jgi:DNA-binding response OmpR family regulator
MNGKILIVDDEEAVRFFTADGLARAGWQTREADSGEAAIAAMENSPSDVLLLDLRMAGMDGLTVMRQTKERWPDTMIIIMTAYASLDSAIEAVRQGAFDYLRKPCSVDNILACANRALAQKQARHRQLEAANQAGVNPTAAPGAVSPAANHVRSGALDIDLGAREILLTGQVVLLTPTEYGLLIILAEAPGQPVTMNRLITEGLGYDPTDPQAQETLRVHISRLRRKLDPKYILTMRGGGYALAKIPPLS